MAYSYEWLMILVSWVPVDLACFVIRVMVQSAYEEFSSLIHQVLAHDEVNLENGSSPTTRKTQP